MSSFRAGILTFGASAMLALSCLPTSANATTVTPTQRRNFICSYRAAEKGYEGKAAARFAAKCRADLAKARRPR